MFLFEKLFTTFLGSLKNKSYLDLSSNIESHTRLSKNMLTKNFYVCEWLILNPKVITCFMPRKKKNVRNETRIGKAHKPLTSYFMYYQSRIDL